MKRVDKGTTRVGYKNGNGQKNLGRCEPVKAGSDHYQYIYRLQCTKCGHDYGSNGSDIFQRKCPNCQGGQPGPEFLRNRSTKPLPPPSSGRRREFRI